MMQSSPLKFTDHLNQLDCYCQSDCSSDVKPPPQTCLTGSITLHCSLLAGKLKLSVILVHQSSMQVTKEACACMHGGYQATYPL